MKIKDAYCSIKKRTIAIGCSITILCSCLGAMTSFASPFKTVGNWISERTEDVIEIAGDAKSSIADSEILRTIEEKSIAAGDAIGCGLYIVKDAAGERISAAGDAFEEKVSDTSKKVVDSMNTASGYLKEKVAGVTGRFGERSSNTRNGVKQNKINPEKTKDDYGLSELLVDKVFGGLLSWGENEFSELGESAYWKTKASNVMTYISGIGSVASDVQYVVQTSFDLLMGGRLEAGVDEKTERLNIAASVLAGILLWI